LFPPDLISYAIWERSSGNFENLIILVVAVLNHNLKPVSPKEKEKLRSQAYLFKKINLILIAQKSPLGPDIFSACHEEEQLTKPRMSMTVL